VAWEGSTQFKEKLKKLGRVLQVQKGLLSVPEKPSRP